MLKNNDILQMYKKGGRIMSIKTRIEKDSIGERAVPANVYYGVQSLRAQENFTITGRMMPKEMIEALAQLKKACAIAESAQKIPAKNNKCLFIF